MLNANVLLFFLCFKKFSGTKFLRWRSLKMWTSTERPPNLKLMSWRKYKKRIQWEDSKIHTNKYRVYKMEWRHFETATFCVFAISPNPSWTPCSYTKICVWFFWRKIYISFAMFYKEAFTIYILILAFIHHSYTYLFE